MSIRSVVWLSLFSLFVACDTDQRADAAAEVPQLFTLLKGEETTLTFNNQLELTTEFNVFNYMYFYNGGGLAAGDFNQDGLVDLYFTANQTANRMYLNEGDMRFREITETAGVAGQPGWATGASVVDINQDGLLDIYVTQVSGYLMLKGTNQLYVCQGIEDGVPVYRDEAAAYGLDFAGFGTQAAFFDYDLDGDLDMYLLNHSLHQNGTFGKRVGKIDERNELAGDKLLRNDNGQFTEVNAEAGIYNSVIGYGLGLATGDVNNDGWPDIYVGNDFHENDYLYLNNQDGTFREVLTEQMQHTSRFSMGVDIADINNDGQRDIFSLDMLPEDPHILKASLGEDGFDVFKFKLGFGYNPQFSRNALQLNNGDGTFSEIGAFAGVEATDWSWAPLFFDFDHDGRRDLFISNGIPRRMNDIDYINFKTNSELKPREEFNDIREQELSFIDKMPEIKLKNKFFRNRGDLRFTDISEGVRSGDVSYSSSAVYVDLDNDGDLDVVTNNIDDEPYVYRNEVVERGEVAGAVLRMKVLGPEGNRDGIGSSVVVYAGAERLVYDYYPVRGYQSSVQAPFYVSLGDLKKIDSAVFIWPDQSYQLLNPSDTGNLVKVNYKSGLPKFDYGTEAGPMAQQGYAFADLTDQAGINFTHRENAFVDFTREPLMPNMASAEGPALAVGDVNGDGLDDFFVGSSKRERSQLFVQTATGKFLPAPFPVDSVYEDVDAVFVDVDGDEDLDLVVAAGGNEYFAKQEPRTQRIYLNDGSGQFAEKRIIPGVYMTASCVLPQDVDGDGDMDLFFGGRVVPRFYGQVPESYLLLNDGAGNYTEVTAEWSDDLKQAGFVKDGTWADVDGDGDADLVLAMEWAPITVYYNEGDRLRKAPVSDQTGWWNTVSVGDVNGDGIADILAGNLGTNNKIRPSAEEPLTMYVGDFDNNEQPEQVLTYYVKGRLVPLANHAELIKQLPPLKKRYLFAQEMAGASVEDIFGADKLRKAERFTVNTFASMVYFGQADGTFIATPLADRAQHSTVNNFCALVDGGEGAGAGGWVMGGNFLGSNIEMGWYDAGFVSILSFDGEGLGGQVRPLGDVRIDGVVNNIKPIQYGGQAAYLVARSDAPLKLVGFSNSALPN